MSSETQYSLIRSGIEEALKRHKVTTDTAGRSLCSCGVNALPNHVESHIATAIMSTIDDHYVMRPQCHYCENLATTRDHIISKYAGGSDSSFNIVPSCASCNGNKKWKIPTCKCDKCNESLTWHIDNVLLTQPRNLLETLYQIRFRKLVEETIEYGRRESEGSGDTNDHVPKPGHRDLPSGGRGDNTLGLLFEEIADAN